MSSAPEPIYEQEELTAAEPLSPVVSSGSLLSSIADSDKPGVLIYNGRPYAVGLLWLTTQEEVNKTLLRQRVRKTGADFYSQRTHISQQHGFGWLRKGHRRGMIAAAAMVADQLVGEWHGVFEADNGWWYVQVRSDTITPNGDRFFTTEEEAYHVFHQEMQQNVWPHAYAPEKWRLQENNIRELKLESILDDLSTSSLTPTNITAVFGSAAVRNMVIGGLLACAVVMAGFTLFTMVEAKRQEEVMRNRVVAQPIKKIKPLEAPKIQGSEAVSPRQLLQQCGEAIAGLYQPLPGWKPQQFNCSVGKANFAWQQLSGSLSDAKNIGIQHWPPNVTVTFNNKVMTANLNLGNLPKLEHSELLNQESALLYLEQNMQPLGAIQVKPVIPAAPVAPKRSSSLLGSNEPAPPPPVMPLPYLEVVVTTGFGPEKMAPLLTSPGLELTTLQWTIPKGVWQYKLKWIYKALPRTVSARPKAGRRQVGPRTPDTTAPAATAGKNSAPNAGNPSTGAKP